MKKFYKFCIFNAIFNYNSAINCMTAQNKN
jgi:hypothetical protein